MPGLDYLGQSDSSLLAESYDPRSENYFFSLSSLALELGGMTAGAYLLKKPASYRLIGRAGRYSNKLSSGLYNLLGVNSVPEAPMLYAGQSDFNRVAMKRAQVGATKFRKTLTSASKAFGIVGVGVFGYEIGKSIFGNSRAFSMGTEEFEKSRYRPLYKGDDEYFDSRAALTQRQRAIQVIHNSQMSTRAAFGNEATFMHY
jgi:hypothetical protein